MLTLIKLFDINMVASSCFGLVSKSNISSSFLPPLTFNDSISDGESEKKAVSDPDISPEKNKRIMRIINAIILSGVVPKKNCSERIFKTVKKESVFMSSKMNF